METKFLLSQYEGEVRKNEKYKKIMYQLMNDINVANYKASTAIAELCNLEVFEDVEKDLPERHKEALKHFREKNCLD